VEKGTSRCLPSRSTRNPRLQWLGLGLKRLGLLAQRTVRPGAKVQLALRACAGGEVQGEAGEPVAVESLELFWEERAGRFGVDGEVFSRPAWLRTHYANRPRQAQDGRSGRRHQVLPMRAAGVALAGSAGLAGAR
jgi:hypothetical protein